MYMFSYPHVLVVHIMRRSKHTFSKFISIFIIQFIQILHHITTLPVYYKLQYSDNSFLTRPGSVITQSVGAGGDDILNDVGRNSLLGNRKKIAKFLMSTFTCRSTFLYDCG
jgi:hypothetical protein